MLSAGDRVGVAVSGGADSVALLHIFQRLSSQFQTPLTVLHVNHHLRGSESDADESFVRTLAGSLGLEIVVEQARVESGNVERQARDARRDFFRHSMEQYRLKRVALGHTRSDQAETVLFRLLRGSGLAGLAGMHWVTKDGLIRPLLSTSREEVREWATAQGIQWREDSSNADSRYARNRLRNEAIPALTRDFNSNLEGVLARTAELASDEESYWIQQIEPIYRGISKPIHLGSIFEISALNELHPAVRRRVLRRAVAEIRGDLRSIDMEHIEAILAVCSSRHGHDRVMIPGVDALRSFDTLLLARPGESRADARHYRMELSLDQSCRLPFWAGFIRVNRVTQEARNCASVEEEPQFAEVADLDERALAEAGGPLAVRNWEPGDELHRPGHEGAEKIKSLFQEHRVLLWERRHWPVLVAGREIVWVRCFGAAANFRAARESRQVVRVTYWPVME